MSIVWVAELFCDIRGWRIQEVGCRLWIVRTPTAEELLIIW